MATALAACSVLADFKGFVGAPTDAQGDASSSSTSDGTAPGGGDASSKDGAPATVDASSNDAEAAAGTRFCGPAPGGSGFYFCSDFDGMDEDGSVGAEWGSITSGAGSTMFLDTTNFRSAPRALHATATSGNFTSVDVLSPPPQTSIVAAADVMIMAAPMANTAICPFGYQQNGDGYPTAVFYVTSQVTYFQSQSDTVAVQFSDNGPPLSPGTWHHVEMDIDMTTSKITATLDGTKMWDGFTMMAPPDGKTPLKFSAGATYLYKATTADVVVDNVTISVK
jgi:hypothetical protein